MDDSKVMKSLDSSSVDYTTTVKLEDNSSMAFSGAESQTINFAVEFLLTMTFDTTLAEILEEFPDVDMPMGPSEIRIPQ